MEIAVTRESCEVEDKFFLDKYTMTAYRWRKQKSEYADNVWFREMTNMSKIDTNAKSEAVISGHENMSEKEKLKTSHKKRPPIPIDIKDVCQFPYEEVFFRTLPYKTKYKGVFNIDFMEGQSEQYIVDWFNKLNKDEKTKLNLILSMVDEKIDMIRDRKRPYYALSEVIIIGYCIKCLFFNEKIDPEKLAQPKELCTKTVHMFVDVFSKCFTMRYKRAAYVKDPEQQVIGMVPCKNIRHRYDQRYMLNIDGWMSKKNWKWINN